MKKKSGFIASSVMFSFFLVFILLAVLVLTSYTHYNQLIKSLNGTILENLKSEIEKKYAGIKNLVKNGSNGYWSKKSAWYKSLAGNYFMTVDKGNSSFSQDLISNINGTNKVIYVAFQFNYGYPDKCKNCDFKVMLTDTSGNNYTIDTFHYLDKNYNKKYKSTKSLVNNTDDGSVNWILFGGILRTNRIIHSIKFEQTNLEFDPSNYGGVFGVNNVVVADITNLYINNSSSNDDKMIEYLLKELPFITHDQKYSLPRI